MRPVPPGATSGSAAILLAGHWHSASPAVMLRCRAFLRWGVGSCLGAAHAGVCWPHAGHAGRVPCWGRFHAGGKKSGGVRTVGARGEGAPLGRRLLRRHRNRDRRARRVLHAGGRHEASGQAAEHAKEETALVRLKRSRCLEGDRNRAGAWHGRLRTARTRG